MLTKNQARFHCLDFHSQEVQTLNKILHCIFAMVFNDESFEALVSLEYFSLEIFWQRYTYKVLPPCDSSSR